jgi:hypothetical protein
VVSAEWDDLMLRLRVSLRNHVGLDDMDVPRFTRLVKDAAPGRCPGDKFVGPKLDAAELVPFYDDREDEGWRRAVDEVLAMSAASEDDAYRRSVFFRPVGLRVGDDELARARRVPLEPGARATLVLQFHNPHLDDDALAGHRLRLLAPDDALRVTAPEAVPRDGTVDVQVEPLAPDAQLTIQIGPAGGHHTHVVERFRVRSDAAGAADGVVAGDGAAAGAGAATGHVADPDRRRDELLGVYDFVRRNATFEPGDRVDFFDRFAGLLPGEPRIREDWALFHLGEGAGAEALRILERLDPDEMVSDDARFALWSLRVNGDDDPAARIEALGLTGEGRFPRLLDELAGLTPPLLARIVPPLVESLPDDQVRELMARVGDRIEAPAALARTAEAYYAVTDDGDAAYAWILGRYRALQLGDVAVGQAILDLAGTRARPENDPELDHIAGHRVMNLVARGDLAEARRQLRVAGHVLGDTERRRLYRHVADRLADTGQSGRVGHGGQTGDAAEVMVELAWAELNDGLLDDATDAVTQARGLWARHGGDAPDWLRDCVAAIEAAWADLESLQEWRTSEEDRRRTLLRERWLNRRILIAGGQRNDEWVAHLQDLTGAEVDWCRAYRDETDDLRAYAQRLDNGYYDLVVHYLQKTGHGTAEVLRPAAEKGGVAWVDTRSGGRRGVVEAAWGFVQRDDGVAVGGG